MRILLQHRRNKFYFRRLGVWTSDVSTAFDFERTGRAIDFVNAHDLNDVQLFIKFADAEFDQVVVLPKRACEQSQLCLFWDCDSERVLPARDQEAAVA